MFANETVVLTHAEAGAVKLATGATGAELYIPIPNPENPVVYVEVNVTSAPNAPSVAGWSAMVNVPKLTGVTAAIALVFPFTLIISMLLRLLPVAVSQAATSFSL